VALVDAGTGRERQLIRLAGAPRHLQLAGPDGPLLVPLENNRELVQLALPGGAVIAATRVGQHPRDAAAIGSLIFTGNEFSNTVSLVRDGRPVAVEPGPLQPGGVVPDRGRPPGPGPDLARRPAAQQRRRRRRHRPRVRRRPDRQPAGADRSGLTGDAGTPPSGVTG
jgi:hypothetical protein